MTFDWNAAIIIFTNLGALGIIGKYLIAGVTKSNENIPVILQIIATHTKGIEELFTSRNDIKLDIKEIQTGIEYCDACNEHKHRRYGDSQPTLTQKRKR